MEESKSSLDEEGVESLPLTTALTTLLEELCATHGGRKVLSPRKVMLAMALYIPNFNLTRQQDAAEAFLHLLSCLREEFSECYVPNYSSLAGVSAFPNCRILTLTKRGQPSEQERWQRHFLGPFNGILGSFLTCQSCSFQITLDFEFFHSLSLSPVLNNGGAIMAGCTVEDCLRQFIVAEQVENYYCHSCWHIAATKYLSLRSGNEKFKSSGAVESKAPVTAEISLILKQCHGQIVFHILCIHLQRASMTIFGELTKVQGHISFPLILNLLPFMKSEVGIKNWEDNFLRKRAKQQNQQPVPDLKHFNLQFDTRMLNCIYGLEGENMNSEARYADELGSTTLKLMGRMNFPTLGESSLAETGGFSDTKLEHRRDEVSMARDCDSLDTHSYHLVSVVEHFGRDGSGHYTVYRRVRTEQEKEFHNGQFAPSLGHWFCISDSQVYSVSEKDVLTAEASLLFMKEFYNSKKAAISLRKCLEAYGIFTYNNEADTDSEQVVRLNCTP
ncbi:Ubiquitin carboxyl-terminal hydrolase 27 [Vitis vinifera]|uniref:ubiquitinyl hydrolase 1 n=1 Tax=Vitis vinifera TaxID=29760 RepID=A0A438KIU9_VITVI|nr:Ubiquitin carboxyl-terminal hydrolase 27 [Vitis vinifera]